jgi:uncharacterized membrane protein (UPF0127 family)
MRAPGWKAIVVIAIGLAIVSYGAYAVLNNTGTVNLPNPPTSFTVNGRTYGITFVAADESSRVAGLTDKRITNTTTMLFVFPSQGIYPFWMSTVNTTLDMIWLNVTGNVGHVVYVVKSAPVCNGSSSCPTYTPTSSADWVLETRGGFSNANGIALGTTFIFH